MHQVGKVLETLKGNKARILMTKHAACGDCGACQHGKENMTLTIAAINEVGAEVGDMVEVNMETQDVLGAAFIIYVIPLIVMVLGIGGSGYLLKQMGYRGNVELYAAFIGFLIMALSFMIIRMFEKRFRANRKYIPEITRIMNRQ
ncbi:positive regulator of sigma(E), RseC/MucC [Geosporobacter subterraneus DSM 17957]|uniref:Positive regulator of sigma(E), RseC/MucC n=1 Tax=Geosporobacter subterraneus DSM 17957 TaxID=1121919 RepID=A0A1M6BTS8_9FIRM|nr:SoxR reducing system RseC family protein [Geosporobacter subterraneus]SHI51954.1 positive regulator of sigma(E), RseC/MucC [Geosporobacter subterraneus DSM 17957]